MKPRRSYRITQVETWPFTPRVTVHFRLNQTTWTIVGDSKFGVLRRGVRIAYQLAGMHVAEELCK